MSGRLVKDINTDSSSPNELIDIEGLYFVADSGASGGAGGGGGGGQENANADSSIGLWKSDGGDGGTPDRSFDGISNLVKANGLLYFIAETEGEFELWSSDGTSAGTEKVDAINPGANDFAAYNLFAVNDTLFFSASGSDESVNGYELWRWNGDDVAPRFWKFISRPIYYKADH